MQKLKSRKLWITIALMLPMIASLFGAFEDESVKIASMIMALMSGGIYTVVQGNLDEKEKEDEDQ